MIRKHSKLLQKIKGMTISELVITLTIISILAVFVTSTYSNYATRTKIANQVSLVTAHTRQVYDLKKDGKDFYLNFDNSTVNDYGAVTKNIGESGANIIKGNDEVMIRPEAVDPDSVRWRCIVYGDGLSESSIPNHCILGSSIFFRILKDNNMLIMIGVKFIKIIHSSVIGLSLVVMKRLNFGITLTEYLIVVIMLQSYMVIEMKSLNYLMI
ncbi:prepilin-type N-terminal cleavage/methylation domain-containing protein [Francisella tularensis]|uniref:Prepilin-type N-terminal cleavage/methylation domain-containing protein n=2 Tax=Francisella tularensis TaxID=263 RepID=A0A0B3VCN7_FRATU|nr:prepilin-type N-terminal cleavage/methylation domain-containing protein [Francisella tularensis]AFX70073.1 prepilin-type N-terminal cleavage/methylation domain-containing protein [Francisella tularensis subsp. holarctica F92]ABI82359.1 possible type IV pilus assembly protein [Francisella tularensis subsp. holarctica OSU18]ABU60858.1 prepilin-type N-terminal cleavage/methylation domain protein [Francisella tularensis subsp. holarctica FTNF002-00]AJI51064.1 hypothetical protein DA46_346 [Franc